jgi:hypothetical protein
MVASGNKSLIRVYTRLLLRRIPRPISCLARFDNRCISTRIIANYIRKETHHAKERVLKRPGAGSYSSFSAL